MGACIIDSRYRISFLIKKVFLYEEYFREASGANIQQSVNEM
jgi:hypothetical protein